jgi:hypothetical protein
MKRTRFRPISNPLEWKKSCTDPNVDDEGGVVDPDTRLQMPARATKKHVHEGSGSCSACPDSVRAAMRSVLCRFLGHKLPRRRRPFFLTERFQRCERCGERVALRDRG